MRDHTKLEAFRLADTMAVLVYRLTQRFPKSETFGLTAQMRRAAVSAPSNIVEGCARSTQKGFVHFLDVALGSVREVAYQASLARRLDMLTEEQYAPLRAHCLETSKVLCSLILTVRNAAQRSGAANS